MPGNPHIPSDNATIACALNELGLQKVPDVIVRTVAFDGLLRRAFSQNLVARLKLASLTILLYESMTSNKKNIKSSKL